MPRRGSTIRAETNQPFDPRRLPDPISGSLLKLDERIGPFQAPFYGLDERIGPFQAPIYGLDEPIGPFQVPIYGLDERIGRFLGGERRRCGRVSRSSPGEDSISYPSQRFPRGSRKMQKGIDASPGNDPERGRTSAPHPVPPRISAQERRLSR